MENPVDKCNKDFKAEMYPGRDLPSDTSFMVVLRVYSLRASAGPLSVCYWFIMR